MGQDLRDLFKDEQVKSNMTMSEGHKARFIEKLDKELPEQTHPKPFKVWRIAASILLLLGLAYGALQFESQAVPVQLKEADVSDVNTLGDVSPELKKVEDFYLASINLQLSKIELTPDNKEVFDGYLVKLEELDKEYQNLSLELTENGPNALTVEALINNLKLRLNLLIRLQDQIQVLEDTPIDPSML